MDPGMVFDIDLDGKPSSTLSSSTEEDICEENFKPTHHNIKDPKQVPLNKVRLSDFKILSMVGKGAFGSVSDGF